MRRPVTLAIAALLALPAAAAAQQPTTPPAPTPPTPPPPTTPAPAPEPPPPAPKPKPKPKPKPVEGKLKLRITPGPVIEGSRIGVRGRLQPRIAGQRVLVRIYRDGHQVHSKSVRPRQDGRFRVTYHSPQDGRIRAVAIHRHTKRMLRATAKSHAMTVIPAEASYGARGPSVKWLQRHLARAHYSVPRSGVFDDGTARAVLAFRKMTGMARTSTADRTVFRALAEGKGRFPVRYRSHGRHVEGDLTHQVLALIDKGGKVHRLYPMSSGKPSTPTVLGHYEVYLKTPGTNSEGMVDSNYFIRGYAIHGYYQVPTYAASHGCLRIPIPNAAEVYDWVQIGTPVDVYYR